jgi:hypothetical protein
MKEERKKEREREREEEIDQYEKENSTTVHLTSLFLSLSLPFSLFLSFSFSLSLSFCLSLSFFLFLSLSLFLVQPSTCGNNRCNNATRWKLVMDECVFVDWQKIRVQENSGLFFLYFSFCYNLFLIPSFATDEIPSGSMPRTFDVIVRQNQVESANAGDHCLFTGCLIVVPEIIHGFAPGQFRTRGRLSLSFCCLFVSCFAR